MIVGSLIAMSGMALVLGLLFTSGGASKLKQISVLGKIASGAEGPRKRGLLFVALGCIGVGSCTAFAGVAAMDAARADRCRARCEAEGFETGRIGPSVDRAPATRFVACTCEGGREGTLELRADAL